MAGMLSLAIALFLFVTGIIFGRKLLLDSKMRIWGSSRPLKRREAWLALTCYSLASFIVCIFLLAFFVT